MTSGEEDFLDLGFSNGYRTRRLGSCLGSLLKSGLIVDGLNKLPIFCFFWALGVAAGLDEEWRRFPRSPAVTPKTKGVTSPSPSEDTERRLRYNNAYVPVTELAVYHFRLETMPSISSLEVYQLSPSVFEVNWVLIVGLDR